MNMAVSSFFSFCLHHFTLSPRFSFLSPTFLPMSICSHVFDLAFGRNRSEIIWNQKYRIIRHAPYFTAWNRWEDVGLSFWHNGKSIRTEWQFVGECWCNVIYLGECICVPAYCKSLVSGKTYRKLKRGKQQNSLFILSGENLMMSFERVFPFSIHRNIPPDWQGSFPKIKWTISNKWYFWRCLAVANNISSNEMWK